MENYLDKCRYDCSSVLHLFEQYSAYCNTMDRLCLPEIKDIAISSFLEEIKSAVILLTQQASEKFLKHILTTICDVPYDLRVTRGNVNRVLSDILDTSEARNNFCILINNHSCKTILNNIESYIGDNSIVNNLKCVETILDTFYLARYPSGCDISEIELTSSVFNTCALICKKLLEYNIDCKYRTTDLITFTDVSIPVC